jgi:thiol-disulfide isomerase/thioredoxin
VFNASAFSFRTICLVFVLCVVRCGILHGMTAKRSIAVPGTSQTSAAENLTGAPVDPFKMSEGHVVVLLFVRTDCPISNRYAPTIRRLSEKFQGKANFWLVYPDATESANRIRTHIEQFRYSIPALRDVHHALVARSHATITPEAAVFSESGKLVYHGRIDNWYEDFGRSRSAPTTHELEDAIQGAIAGKSMAPEHANAVGCYISDLK